MLIQFHSYLLLSICLYIIVAQQLATVHYTGMINFKFLTYLLDPSRFGQVHHSVGGMHFGHVVLLFLVQLSKAKLLSNFSFLVICHTWCCTEWLLLPPFHFALGFCTAYRVFFSFVIIALGKHIAVVDYVCMTSLFSTWQT